MASLAENPERRGKVEALPKGLERKLGILHRWTREMPEFKVNFNTVTFVNAATGNEYLFIHGLQMRALSGGIFTASPGGVLYFALLLAWFR